MLFQSLGIHMNMDLKIITGSGQCYVQAVHQDEHAVGVLKKKLFVNELKARKNASLLKHLCSFWYQNDSAIWNVTHGEVNETYHRVIPK